MVQIKEALRFIPRSTQFSPPPSPLHRAVRPATSSLLCASGAGPPECGPIPLSMRFFVENPAIGISLLEPGPSPHGMRPAQIPAGLRLEDRDVESNPAALRCVDRGFGFVAPDELPRPVDSRLAPIGLALAAPFSRQRIDRRILRAEDTSSKSGEGVRDLALARVDFSWRRIQSAPANAGYRNSGFVLAGKMGVTPWKDAPLCRWLHC